jgi:glycosyltransferase involved in cell wall biosynthesis
MRVLFLGPAVPAQATSEEPQQACSLIREAAKDVQVYVVAPAPAGAQTTFARSLRDSVARIEMLPTDTPSRWSRMGKPPEIVAQHSSELDSRVREVLADEAIDLVHVDSLLLAPWVRLPRRLPSVLRHSFGPRAAATRFPFRKILRRAIGSFDVHLCPLASDAQALEHLAHRPVPYRLLPPGVDCDYFDPPDVPFRRNPEEILFLGHPAATDDPEALRWFARKVLPENRSRHPSMIVTVAGPNLSMAVRAVAQREGLQLVEELEDARPLLARATCLIAPNVPGSSAGHWILEALAMGTPVVATPHGLGGLPVQDGQDLLVAADPEDFANDCRRLMRDHELREKISRNARRRAETAFAWPVVGKQLVETWRAAAGARSRK